MTQTLFSTENDVNNDWLFYIENEANSLSQRHDFAIKNYIDREIFNPDMKSFLSTSEAQEFTSSVNDTEGLTFNLSEELHAKTLSDWFNVRFRKLKTKVKQIFCNVVNGIGEIDTKAIIKAVLLALIPAFSAGLPAVILPIIIGLLAYLIKHGISMTCPV